MFPFYIINAKLDDPKEIDSRIDYIYLVIWFSLGIVADLQVGMRVSERISPDSSNSSLCSSQQREFFLIICVYFIHFVSPSSFRTRSVVICLLIAFSVALAMFRFSRGIRNEMCVKAILNSGLADDIQGERRLVTKR